MKTNNVLILLFIAIASLYSCRKDENMNPDDKGSVSLSFTRVSALNTTILKSTEAIEDARAVIVSIENESGTVVANMEQLELLNINGSFITRPISLPVGNYRLTQFIVIDDAGNALYITPLGGSPMAYLVSNPLPISFSVDKDTETKLAPEVIDATIGTPEDFGYTTFSFNVVETFDFLLGVFVYNEASDNYAMTNAVLTVTADGNPVYTDSLEAVTNTVTLNDAYSQYILTIAKEGYGTYIDTFSNAELKLYYASEDNGPLKVYLTEASCNCPPTVTDIDGNVYTTVKIGDQCWMAENLKTTHFNDGNPIHQELDNYTWTTLTTPAFCWYGNNESAYKEVYGALYNSFTVTSGNLAPIGWHIPSKDEWISLVLYLGGDTTGISNGGLTSGGGKLKEEGFEHWFSPNTGANNSSGFTGLPGGIRWGSRGTFGYMGSQGSWWTTTEYSFDGGGYLVNTIFRFNLLYNYESILWDGIDKQIGLSVRCIKDCTY